jgi:hypothetical protein
MIKIKAEINEVENKDIIERTNKAKDRFFFKKIGKHLAKLIKTKRID